MRIKILAWMAASSTLSFVAGMSAAHAGFEFSANKPSAPAAATSVYGDAPMPIVPTPSVDAMPLDESSKLLSADASGNYIGLVPSSPAYVATSSATLVINPYPLQNGAQAAPMTEWGAERMGKMVVGKPAPKAQVMFSGYGAAPSGLTPVPGGEPEPLPLDISPYPLNKTSAKTPEAASTGDYSEIVGFGRELPLAFALSQVVPANYSYAFSQSIDTGAIVSWEGGKPWNMVLKDMLAKAGLKAEIQENRVLVTKA